MDPILINIHHVFQPLLLGVFIFLVYIQTASTLTQLEHIYVAICQVLIILTGICTVCLRRRAIRVLHYAFPFIIVFTPFLTSNPLILLFILIVIIAAMALRAQLGRCVLGIYEGKQEDRVLDYVDQFLNFNILFFIAGVAYSVLLYNSLLSK